MAKKANRLGRPAGSKNKKNGVRAPQRIAPSFAKMEIAQLRRLIDNLEGLLAQTIQQQRSLIEGRLAELRGYVSQKAVGGLGSDMRVAKTDGRKGRRAKPQPKYQSKKDKSLKWTGRGVMPRWMREETKGTKLTKDSFLIK
jgi:DNA-binding protein H-NS